MKRESTDFFRLVPASSTFQSFDAIKFIKRLKEKEKPGGWQRFLHSVEEKRKEIWQDLLSYQSEASAS